MIVDLNQTKIDEQGERVKALRQAIRDAFPDETYSGQITPFDGAFTPELDDDQILYESLKGRSWTEIPHDLLLSQPDGYLLLTDQAYGAFLAAWLTVSLEDIDHEDTEVRELMCYSFSPNGDQGWKQHRLRTLTSQQRGMLRALMAEFTERGTSPFVKDYAVKAFELIDNLE